MSWFAVSAALALGATPARAAEPPVAPVAAAAAPPAVQRQDDLDARHRFGAQLGGSSFVQLVYRLRLFGHVYAELGGGAVPEATLNASAGLMVARSTGTRFFPYAAGGVGFGGSAGGGFSQSAPVMAAPEKCAADLTTPGCPWDSVGVAYGYGRAGVGINFGAERRAALLIDLGVWVGNKLRTHDDGTGKQTHTSDRFVWPIPGVALFVSL